MFSNLSSLFKKRDHDYSKALANESTTDQEHFCAKSLRLDVQLQKANEVIKTLQKRCSEKTKEINRLRSSLKRAEVNKSNLKVVLNEMRDKEMISNECHRILEVII